MASMAPDDEQLAAVINVVTNVIGEDIVAVYHYGSAVQGGLRPASDLDVFVVSRPPLTDAHRAALVDGLLPLSGPVAAPGRPVEVTVARHASLAPWPASPVRQFQFGEWLRADFEAGFRSPAVIDPDLAPLVATLLTASTPVVGPPAAELLAPVPQQSLLAAMQASSGPLLDDLVDDTTNVLLTLCRMLFTAATGEVAPKDVAAEWVLDHLRPEAPTQLAVARDRYLHGPLDQPDHDMAEADRLAAALFDWLSRIDDPSSAR